MRIQIITDSASDMDRNEFENLHIVPLSVTIDDVTYLDGVDLTKDEFYEKQAASASIPMSSLASPYQFEEVYNQIKAAGDEAIVLTISSELSGTYRSAMTAAMDCDHISVVDTLQVSAAQRLLVLYCRRLIEAGMNRAEIVAELEEAKQRILIFAAVDTLKYLLKGGRISKGSAIIGGIIGIKPIVTLENGRLIAVGKARGSKQSSIFLNRKIEEAGGIDYTMPIAVGYSGTDDSNLRKYIENNSTLAEPAGKDLIITQIGSAVGTHSGPGAVLVTFFRKKA